LLIIKYFIQGYVTGGRDGVVTMWDPLFEHCLKAFKVEGASMSPGSVLLQNLPPVRALHTDEDKILIGTGNDEVCENRSAIRAHILNCTFLQILYGVYYTSTLST